ncbi:MAG: four helix bundle protein [Gammaproteobacteria bacterium]|nr:four helix bundle protein [Gammaproteobacteria bacterium]
MDTFEDLEVWKRGVKLASKVYFSLASCKDYSLKDQLTRAAVSISSNIAEGYERNSKNLFAYHLQVAKGSCGELRSQLYICTEIGIINIERRNELQQEAIEISKMLHGLIRHCRKKEEIQSSIL